MLGPLHVLVLLLIILLSQLPLIPSLPWSFWVSTETSPSELPWPHYLKCNPILHHFQIPPSEGWQRRRRVVCLHIVPGSKAVICCPVSCAVWNMWPPRFQRRKERAQRWCTGHYVPGHRNGTRHFHVYFIGQRANAKGLGSVAAL